ncbi:hypothetical protein [Enterovibrio coralii]|nr:hypothetical protein [Enterovibrio coralii]
MNTLPNATDLQALVDETFALFHALPGARTQATSRIWILCHLHFPPW